MIKMQNFDSLETQIATVVTPGTAVPIQFVGQGTINGVCDTRIYNSTSGLAYVNWKQGSAATAATAAAHQAVIGPGEDVILDTNQAAFFSVNADVAGKVFLYAGIGS